MEILKYVQETHQGAKNETRIRNRETIQKTNYIMAYLAMTYQ